MTSTTLSANNRTPPPPPSYDRVWGLVSVTVTLLAASVLLVAVGLKFTHSRTPEAFWLPPMVRTVGLQVELLVGVWLLTGWARLTARLAAAALFLTLAGVSLTLALTGQRDCGCFGAVAVSPWATFALDTLCGIALLCTPPRGWRADLRVSLTAVGGLALLTAAAIGVLTTPQATAVLARWSGDYVTLADATIDLGDAHAGTTRVARVVVRNASDTEVEVLGGHVACSCMALSALRFPVPAGGEATVEIEVTYKGSEGRFTHGFELFVDRGQRRTLAGQITGIVTATEP